jgi:circadian clock protein KaiB
MKATSRGRALAWNNYAALTKHRLGESDASMSRRIRFKLQLYVADDALNSSQALVNLTRFCEAYLPDPYAIEVIDVFQDPARALAAGVIMTPTLIKLAPAPVRRVIGTLSQPQPLLLTFGIEAPIQ